MYAHDLAVNQTGGTADGTGTEGGTFTDLDAEHRTCGGVTAYRGTGNGRRLAIADDFLKGTGCHPGTDVGNVIVVSRRVHHALGSGDIGRDLYLPRIGTDILATGNAHVLVPLAVPTESLGSGGYRPCWGCRCTVVQVRKSKYPVTDHDEAMSLGELATGKDTKGIFRFNSGKQGKAVPDYNPYTISRCRDCDIANGKLKLAFVPDNELCAACAILQKCAADKAKSERAIERTHYLHEMEPLLKKKVAKVVEGKNMNIGFSKEGNKHLFSDTFGRTRIVSKDDLKELGKYLEQATYIEHADLTHTNDLNIEHFYYFKVRIHGKWVRLNVAKQVIRKDSGYFRIKYFLYSVNDIVE